MTPPTKENVLELQTRRDVYELVVAKPGIHLRAIAEETGQAVGTVEYHLYQLLKFSLVHAREAGGVKAFYSAEMDHRDKDLLAALHHEAPRAICAELLLHPRRTPKKLKQILGIPSPTLSFHLKKLVGKQLLEEEKKGRSKELWVREPEKLASLLVAHQAAFSDDAVDRFVDAWNLLTTN